MNKYIKTDIEQGLQYLKVGIMNALAAIEDEKEKDITLGEHVPFSLVIKCAEERGWIDSKYYNDDMFNNYEVCYYYMWTPDKSKYVCIEGCLWEGYKTEIRVVEDE